MVNIKPEPVLDEKDLAEGDEHLNKFAGQLGIMSKIDEAQRFAQERARIREQQRLEQERVMGEWRDMKRRYDAGAGKKK